MVTPASPDNKPEFQPHIAGLRGVAISLVILSHYSVVGFSGGFIGVDIFFVISGFLITQLLAREYDESRNPFTRVGRISLSRFYLRRVRRIVPAATVVTLATITFGFFSYNIVKFGTILSDAVWSQLFVANLNFSLQDGDYFQHGGQTSLFTHFWSLAVEEQFYLLWPVLITAALSFQALKIGKHSVSWQNRLIISVSVLIAFSFAVMNWLFEVFPVGSYYLLGSRAWELGIGGLAALVVNFTKIGEIRANPKLIDLLFLATFASIFLVNNRNFAYALVIPVVLSAVFVGWAGRINSRSTSMLSTKPLQFIGKISYSLYLWHWPIQVFAKDKGLLNTPLDYAVAVLTTFALATCSYYFVETKFIQRKKPIRGLITTSLSRTSRLVFVTRFTISFILVLILPLWLVLPVSGQARESISTSISDFMKSGQGHYLASMPSPTPSQKPRQVGALASYRAANDAHLRQSITQSKRSGLGDATKANIYSSFQGTWRDSFGWECQNLENIGAYDCSIGFAAAPKTWLVIGDSMSAMYQKAFFRIVQDYPQVKIRLIWHPQCPNGLTKAGLKPDASLTTGFTNESCIATHAYFLRVLDQQKFDLVLMAGFSDDAGASYLAEATKLASHVKRSARNLIIASGLPTYPDLAGCLNSDLSNLASCSGRPASTSRDFLVAKRVGAGYFSLGDWLCLNQICPAVIGDLPVINHLHLNPPLAYLLGDALASAFGHLSKGAF